MSDEKRADEPTPLLIRIGLAAGLLGIAAGVVVGWRNLDKLGELFKMQNYTNEMLVPLGFAAVAVGCAVAEIIRNDRLTRAPGMVFVAGLGAALAPLLLGIALVIFILWLLVAVLAD